MSRSHGSKKLGFAGQQLQFEFIDGYEMLHKAWNSKGEVPYCFPRSSIKFQGHTGQNITDFDPNWAFPDYRPVAAFKSLRFALFILDSLPDDGYCFDQCCLSVHPSVHPSAPLSPLSDINTACVTMLCVHNQCLVQLLALPWTLTLQFMTDLTPKTMMLGGMEFLPASMMVGHLKWQVRAC